MASTEIAVSVDHVVKRYGGFTALHGVSIDIRECEFFTLLGPSGCGKTTLLRAIAGFEDVSEGRLLLKGTDITDLPPHKRPVNTVFQQYALFPHMTVFENVMFGLLRKKWIQPEAQRRTQDVLEMVQLSDFASRKPGQLSGGQQQRVALARALAPRPEVLLLDEPLSALDLKLRQAVRSELKALQRETGIAFVFVTHDQEEALTMSDRICVMSNGRVQQIGRPKDVYEAPINRFVADFVGETNLLDVRVQNISAGQASVTLPGGKAFVCPAAAVVDPGVGHLSVRPERIQVTDTGQGDLDAIVTDHTYLGTDIQLHVRLPDDEVMSLRLQNSQTTDIPQQGQSIGLLLEAGATRLLAD